MDSFKFLGMILDSHLSFKQHIQYVRRKCLKRLNLFRCLVGSTFGADRVTLLRLYRTLVLPIIEYGSVVYVGASAVTLKSLEAQQNAFLRIALGAMRTSPVNSLQIESGVAPLYIRRMEQTLRYAARVKLHQNHPSLASLNMPDTNRLNSVAAGERRMDSTIAQRITSFSNQLQWTLPQIIPIPTLTVPPWKLPPIQLSYLSEQPKINMDMREVQQQFYQFCDENRKSLFIYTDGSKIGNRTGNAVFINGYKIQHRLPDDTSVFVAELHAIYVALKTVCQSRTPNIVICSDSKSALQSIANPPFSHHLQVYIRNLHTDLHASGFQIIFLWVPSHCGIQGNELVDFYAKQSLSLVTITDIPINMDSVKTAIRQTLAFHWQTQWQADTTVTQLRTIKLTTKSWGSSSRKNRQEEKMLCRLRIGHTFITHSHCFKQITRPQCDTCDEDITVSHLLIDCPKYQQHRLKLKNYCQVNRINLTLTTLLGNEHPDMLKLLFVFLRDTGLYDAI